MTTPLSTGGGTSAVAASAHAACERFRRTDPLVTRMNRRALAAKVGAPDLGAGIPEARWMRAMTFEALVRHKDFVSELLTTAVGRLRLPRPTAVRIRSGRVNVAVTAEELALAHAAAVTDGAATMLSSLAVPFLHLEHVEGGATEVKPDFAIVCPRTEDDEIVGSWLIMGDAKDYERVRSRIDDGRLLKGFLQVALGAESAANWSRLPAGMQVHRCGALAVPRNNFLRPEALVERLDDHRAEVRARAQERLQAGEGVDFHSLTADRIRDHLEHLEAAFDPAACTTCNLFSYCRDELRSGVSPESLLIEIGVDRLLHPALVPLVEGTGPAGEAPAATIAQVQATLSGFPVRAARRRTDPAGLPGTVNVVLAKSDSAALGVYGIALQRVTATGPGAWVRREFYDPQSPDTRRAVMGLLGSELSSAMAELQAAAGLDGEPEPVHVVVPDKPTADLLVAMADSLAGVEISRLRWQRDEEMGREPQTFDGGRATIPPALTPEQRLAVSFLLEEDRARAMSLRQPIIDLRTVLVSHLVPGGPASDSGRLDYLLRWAVAGERLDHQEVSDEIAQQRSTPGARLSNVESDDIHRAQKEPERYTALVRAAVDYKIDVLERALTFLATLPDSRLGEAHRHLEGAAQTVWRRRMSLQASDLVRFSRTYRTWRNAHVDMMADDEACFAQLSALADPAAALDRAQDAGVRDLAVATVVSVEPVRLAVGSRRLVHGCTVVALHVNGEAVVERNPTTLRIQKGSFKVQHLPVGMLVAEDGVDGLRWTPPDGGLDLAVGDRLVLADVEWFGGTLSSGHEIKVNRPAVDTRSAPKPDCEPESYANSPDEHRWCCRPHVAVEAEFADLLAERRERGELNPQAWPPVVDDERFDIVAAETDLAVPLTVTTPPDGRTMDDHE
ncbi:hypothetical protein ACI79C_03140 [Geodermatophilus sp. SYSU D00697]